MSIQYTYDDLVDAIKDFAEENDTEFSARIDDFIGKAETRVLRDLDLELFEGWLQLTIDNANRVVARPADVIEINAMFIRDPSAQKWKEVPRRSFEYCIMYAPTETASDVPEFYAEYDEDSVYVVPTPNLTYTSGNAMARCTVRPTGLATGNQTTWLGTNVGDLLFNACMIEAYDYLKNQASMDKAANKYMSLLPGLEREMADVKRPSYKGLNTQRQGADS